MGIQVKEQIKEFKKWRKNELKKELKANRKRNGNWLIIPGIYPCPCQCLAIRYIKPRGKQNIFRTIKETKRKALGIFTITEEKQIYVISTYIPEKKGKELYWKQTKMEEISKSKVFQMIRIV